MADATQKRGFWGRIAPALTLAAMAPLFAEILLGATRFGAFFVFPLEMAIWGGGAVMIRELVRRNDLGWRNMVLLALALAFAEEFLIQQTSIAPVVVQIRGVEYARAFGINYVYLLWALVYEAVLVVLLPIMMVELLYPSRRKEPWLNGTGWAVHVILFLLACPMAWYGWTQQARVQVFHQPPYDPPATLLAIGAGTVALLMLLALGPWRRVVATAQYPIGLLHPVFFALGGAAWAAIWFGVELYAFGIDPAMPPAAVMAVGLGVALAMLLLMPRFAANPGWSDRHRAWLIAGTMIATMLIFFQAGFDRVNAPLDFWFKAGVDAIASALFVLLVMKVGRRPAVVA